MNKMPFLITALIAIVSATPWSVAQDALNRSTAGDRQSADAIDADLADRVRRSVVADRDLSAYAAKISIVSTNRNVRLTGLVQNEGEKAQIGAKAAVIAGEYHVVNDLKVLPATTGGMALRDLIEHAGEPRAAVAAAN